MARSLKKIFFGQFLSCNICVGLVPPTAQGSDCTLLYYQDPYWALAGPLSLSTGALLAFVRKLEFFVLFFILWLIIFLNKNLRTYVNIDTCKNLFKIILTYKHIIIFFNGFFFYLELFDYIDSLIYVICVKINP